MELPKLPQCIEETRTSSARIELGQVKDASQYPYSDFIFGRMPEKAKYRQGFTQRRELCEEYYTPNRVQYFDLAEVIESLKLSIRELYHEFGYCSMGFLASVA